ncbi:MAG TPA: phenylalanine--tRNA ligase subunit alpha, partial [bacterium]|nr:phenylalanine--tRNA ligase subunit alpha [bacterium]
MDWEKILDSLAQIREEAAAELAAARQEQQRELWRVKYLGRRGRLAQLTALLAEAPPAMKPR